MSHMVEMEVITGNKREVVHLDRVLQIVSGGRGWAVFGLRGRSRVWVLSGDSLVITGSPEDVPDKVLLPDN